MTLKSVDTLLDVLHFADSHTAVIVPELGINVTYDSLRQQVIEMANALASAGIRRGDAVALALPNGLPAIVSFLALSGQGAISPIAAAEPLKVGTSSGPIAEIIQFCRGARQRAGARCQDRRIRAAWFRFAHTISTKQFS